MKSALWWRWCQGISLPCAQCSQDRLWIYYNHKQDAEVAEGEWNNEVSVCLETTVDVILKYSIKYTVYLALMSLPVWGSWHDRVTVCPFHTEGILWKKLSLQRYEPCIAIAVGDNTLTLPSCWTTGEEDSRRIITSSSSVLDPSCQVSPFNLQTLERLPQWSAGCVISCLHTRWCWTHPALNVCILPVSSLSRWK